MISFHKDKVVLLHNSASVLFFGIKNPPELTFYKIVLKIDQRHISLKVPKVEFNLDVSVWHSLLSTHTLKSNLTLCTNLHAMLRTHHFDFNIRF